MKKSILITFIMIFCVTQIPCLHAKDIYDPENSTPKTETYKYSPSKKDTPSSDSNKSEISIGSALLKALLTILTIPAAPIDLLSAYPYRAFDDKWQGTDFIGRFLAEDQNKQDSLPAVGTFSKEILWEGTKILGTIIGVVAAFLISLPIEPIIGITDHCKWKGLRRFLYPGYFTNGKRKGVTWLDSLTGTEKIAKDIVRYMALPFTFPFYI